MNVTGDKRPEKVKLFLQEIAEVCKKHQLSLAHEDGHGAFLVCDYDKDCAEWLAAAWWEGSV